MQSMLECPDVSLLVLKHELHLLGELAFNIARERVEPLLSAFSDLVTPLLVFMNHRQLHRLQRLHAEDKNVQ